MKRIVTIALILSMLMSLLTFQTTFADAIATGKCGDAVYWSLDNNGTLTITGSGPMDTYSSEVSSKFPEWNSYKYQIKKIVFEGNVTYVGQCAFHSYPNITEVQFSDSITTIGAQAFHNCSGLTSITIPENITTINTGAFSLCENLYDINITDNTREICYDSFSTTAYSNDLSNWVDGALYLGNILLSSNINLTGTLSIRPGTTVIAEYAFENRSGITSINFPDSIKHIGTRAFFRCENLTSVKLPPYAYIASYAFGYCTNLASISIPDTVAGIEYYAFSNTAYYKNSANWSDNILYINNALIASKGSISGAYNVRAGTTVIAGYAFNGQSGLTSVTMPDSVKHIGFMAFNKCTGLTSVKLSSSVTDMGIYAFADCTGITSIDIPDTVLSIGKGAFSGCTKLSNVKVSKNLETLEAELFKNCSVLNNIVIPDKVKSIGESAFCNCYLITDIVIPDSVTVIGNKAFQSCKALTSVAMGNGVRNIEKNAFYLCNKLTDVSAKSIGAWLAISFADPSANPTRYSKSLYINDELMTSLVIPQGITTINDYAFYMVSSIETITFPETISNVGSNAFYEVSPDKLYINDLNGWLNIDFANGDANPTADTTAIYFNNEPVKNLIIPEGVEVIKPYSFYRAAVLESISLPSTLKEIGNRAFTSCKGLKSISFPKALEKIDTYAFGYCSLLESIYLPSSVSSIENYAFYYCNALNNVYYVGNSDLWANVTIGFNNSILTTENINYIYTSSLIDNDVAVVKPLYVPNGKNIICVCYKDGSVTDVSICLYKEQETINFTIENEYDSVKIMVWDNVFDIAPLSSPETIAVSKQFVNKV